MRVLFTIAHFFNRDGSGDYGSLKSKPQARIEALSKQIAALHQLFGKFQYCIDFSHRRALSANQERENNLEIVICTTQGYHLLNELSLSSNLWTHHPTKAESMLLGFECQKVLKENLGKYDYYCFLEDDLIIHDPYWFVKLKWFCQQSGDRNLLQPNRYEISIVDNLVRKIYIDGSLNPGLSARFQNIQEQPLIKGGVMGSPVSFCRTSNPHSGCYFLNASQMAYWAKSAHFLNGDTSFIGPLESAATLGIMRTFRIYKPTSGNMNFLEIQHFNQAWSEKILKTHIPGVGKISFPF